MTLYCVQKPMDQENFEIAMVEMYNRMYEKYFEEKKLIPKGNLVEVRYEDLKENPYDVIKKIYKELNIQGFEKNEEKLHTPSIWQEDPRPVIDQGMHTRVNGEKNKQKKHHYSKTTR